MKKLIALTAACALALPPLAVYAEQAHHPEQQKTGGDMPAQGGQPAPGGMMDKMQKHMETMMQQMDAIHKTDDPEKRDKLLQEHGKSMQEGMQMMRGMGGGMMKGMMGEGGGGMMGKGGSGMMKGGDKAMCQRTMEQRMDMMQMMMDQMMQHRQAEESHPGSGKSR